MIIVLGYLKIQFKICFLKNNMFETTKGSDQVHERIQSSGA